MRMEFTDDGVAIDKPPSDLDRLVLDIVAVFDDVGVEYVVVSGYVAVLFGRARATEDIDVITERFDRDTADALADGLRDVGFWGPAMPLDGMYETLADDLPVRIAEDGHRVPNVELKFATDEYDQASLRETVSVQFGDETLRVGAFELQIAYKLHMEPRRTSRMPCTSTRSLNQPLTTPASKRTSNDSASRRSMSDSDELEAKHARNRERRFQRIKAWAEYVRTHPDEDWGEQVNRLVNAQLESARHHEDERPDLDSRRGPERDE